LNPSIKKTGGNMKNTECLIIAIVGFWFY